MAPPKTRSGPRRPLHRATLALLLLLSSAAPPAAALPQAPPSGVDIHASPADGPADAAGSRAITATLYRGAEGRSRCRGGPMTVLSLPPPPAGRPAAERCFDLPGPAACGVFAAARADGCEARLFAEPACPPPAFVTTHVFAPDARPVGGLWRSVAVRCGVVPPDPAALGTPPLAGLITSQTGS